MPSEGVGDLYQSVPLADMVNYTARIRTLEAELAAEREAVRVLGREVDAAWTWNDSSIFDRKDTWPHHTAEAVLANPIASAAVRGEGAR